MIQHLLKVVFFGQLSFLLLNCVFATEEVYLDYRCDYGAICNWRDAVVTTQDANCVTNKTLKRNGSYFRIYSEDYHYFPRNLFQFAKPKRLHLFTPNLKELKEIDFEDGGSITQIYVFLSSIITLPANVFRKLPNLKIVSIENSPIVTIDQHAFNESTKITHLKFTNTSVSALHPEVLQPLTALEEIQLVYNKLATLEPRLFAHNINLKVMTIYDQISQIDYALFNSLSDVNLDLQYYSHIAPAANEVVKLQFKLTPAISTIKFTNYDLEDVNFEDSHLATLTIWNGRVHANTFQHLQSTWRLALNETYNSDNQTLVIDEFLFAKMDNLKNIYFSNCKITSVSCKAFANNANLTNLNIYEDSDEHAARYGPCILGDLATKLDHLVLQSKLSEYSADDYKAIAPNLNYYSDRRFN